MKLINSFIYSFIAKLLSLVIILIARILTARLLGPSDLGSVGNALNFTTIISRWGSLGIAPATQFTTSKYSDQKNTVLVYVVLISIFVGLLNLVILKYFNSEIGEWQFSADSRGRFAYSKFLPWMPLVILSMTLPIFLLGSCQIRKYSLTQILPLVFQTIIIARAFAKEEPLNTIIHAQIANWILTLVIAFATIDYKFFAFQYDSGLLFIFIKYALNAWPQIILQFGISRFAVLIGSQYLSTKDLGYYILASNLSESYLLIITSITPLLFNQIASQGTNLTLLETAMRVANTCLLLALLLTISLGKPIFIFVFGIEFEQTWNLLLLLIGTVFFQAVVRICISYIAALGKNRILSSILLVQLIVLFVVTALACPQFGNIGLCCASMCASLVGFMLCLRTLRKSDMLPEFNILHALLINKADMQTSYLLMKKAFGNKSK